MTPLDAAHAAMEAAPGDDAARLRFYGRLADGELFLLLEREPEDETLSPQLFDLEDGPVVLAFDLEERLSAFTGMPAPYAALPGRVVAGLLAGRGIGLGLNLGDAPSAMLLPPEAVDWLAETIGHAPTEAEARLDAFRPPSLPEALVAALDAKLAGAGGLASHALVAAVDYADARTGHLLAFVGCLPGAEPALARAVSEALTFSGIEAGALDVGFLSPDEGAAVLMERVALRFDLPVPVVPELHEEHAPAAPGMDPDRPPILR
ncbi:type III secretion system (T3SS) SseB-like protein [Cereibacter ovatus]|uniref:Type III secretion system (T3SS) SseB-like protein n=1 Tax=Cereibacter ovatus TaxID=439529 RepID=A0A285D1T3_9RHOB|nr:SseB family protein [Cereibacter ovatus]SNX73771.1 type III secretion system (T3SS) SseB-like protein [Cereibacter ovatus]